MSFFGGLFDDLLPAIGAIAGVALAPATGGASLALDAGIGGALGGAAKGLLTGGNVLEDAALGGVMGAGGEMLGSAILGAGTTAATDTAGSASDTLLANTTSSVVNPAGQAAAAEGFAGTATEDNIGGGGISNLVGSDSVNTAAAATTATTANNISVGASTADALVSGPNVASTTGTSISAGSSGGIFSNLESGNFSGAASAAANDVMDAKPSTLLSAGGLAVNAASAIMTEKNTKAAESGIGAAPEAPLDNPADQLSAEEDEDALRKRQGLAGNILTSPTGFSTGGRSASQMLLS